MRRGVISLLSGGLFLLPAGGPVQDHVQPMLPPVPMAAPEKNVPGYACGHPRTGWEYAKIKGVGKLPEDLITGDWLCSDGCGAEIECSTYLKYGRLEYKTLSQFTYVFRKRKNR